MIVKPIKAGMLDHRAVVLEVNNVLHGEGRTMVKELQKTTKSWRRKVRFGYIVEVSGDSVAVMAGPESGNVQVWNWLDQGTRPHPIVPRRAKMLRFRTGYKAKTRPWWLGSGSGGATGDVAWAKRVKHPGTQAREWTQTLASKRKRPFARNVNWAVKRGAARLFKK